MAYLMKEEYKVYAVTVNDDEWIKACEDGYEAIAAAFGQDYDWIGHFEMLAMAAEGPLWIASGTKGPTTRYATITVRSR